MKQLSPPELEAWLGARSQSVLAATPETNHETWPALSAEFVAAYIDHTLLKPEASEAQIRKLCQEARAFGFASVCVNPTWVEWCVEWLAGSSVKTCTVIGFPLGATLTSSKVYETQEVIRLGAQEVDMVINVGRLKDQNYYAVYTDIAAVVAAAHAHHVLTKVIIETFLLSDEEKVMASLITEAAGADFVKTSTGFNGGGATLADVRLMRRAISPSMGLKAAGGVRTGVDALQMIAAGVTRLGASAGVQIVQSIQDAAADQPAKTAAQPAVTTGETY